jgi:hypothetical protein
MNEQEVVGDKSLPQKVERAHEVPRETKYQALGGRLPPRRSPSRPLARAHEERGQSERVADRHDVGQRDYRRSGPATMQKSVSDIG